MLHAVGAKMIKLLLRHFEESAAGLHAIDLQEAADALEIYRKLFVELTDEERSFLIARRFGWQTAELGVFLIYLSYMRSAGRTCT